MLTSFLESASHTKAATAIPALLCTIAALYKRNNIHHLKIWLKWCSCEFHGKNWAIHYRLCVTAPYEQVLVSFTLQNSLRLSAIIIDQR